MARINAEHVELVLRRQEGGEPTLDMKILKPETRAIVLHK